MAFELCLPNLIDSVVEEFFDEALSKVGFRKVRDRFYVRSRIAEMNDVIDYQASKTCAGIGRQRARVWTCDTQGLAAYRNWVGP